MMRLVQRPWSSCRLAKLLQLCKKESRVCKAGCTQNAVAVVFACRKYIVI